MSVGRLCTREVHLVESNEPVCEAARRMRDRRVGTLVVVDAVGRPRGIVTDRDLVVRGLAATAFRPNLPVERVMTTAILTAPEATPIEDALATMRASRHRRLLVTDAEGRLVGMLSLDDVLALLGKELYRVGDLVSPIPVP